MSKSSKATDDDKRITHTSLSGLWPLLCTETTVVRIWYLFHMRAERESVCAVDCVRLCQIRMNVRMGMDGRAK